MARIKIEAAELQYTDQGSGEAVLLVHGGIIADGLAPLLKEAALTRHYRLISFHRRGYGGSSRATPPVTMADQAKDCLTVMRHLDVDQAHVVAHSYGGLIALQLASDVSNRLRSVSLIEPALLGLIPSAPQLVELFDSFGQLYQAGDKAGVVHNWLIAQSGPNYRDAFDKVLPTDWYDRAVADIDTVFQVELPALGTWKFGPDEAKQIRPPILSVLGEDHPTTFAKEVDELLHTWFLHMETGVVPNSLHWPQLTNPQALAQGLADFISRHRM
jgi:pimeloyl-ACP methyl ester carboxylesterase